MEEIRVLDEFRLAHFKRENVRRSLEQAQAKASDILLFAMQWKDLENHYDLVESELGKRSQEVELKEKEMETKSLALEERASKIQAAEAEAGVLKTKAECFRREVDAKQKELGSLQNSVETCMREFKSEGKKLTEIRKLVKGCEMDLSSKSKQLVVMQETVKKTQGELELKEKQLGLTKTEFKSEEKKLTEIRKMVKGCEMDLSSKSKQLVVMQESVKKTQGELESKEKQLGLTKTEFKAEEKKLTEIRKLVKDCGMDLSSKSKQLIVMQQSVKKAQGELELKEKQLGQTKTELMRYRDEVDTEQENLKNIQNDARQQKEEFDRVLKDLTLVLGSQEKCCQQLAVVEEQLGSRQKLLEIRSSELQCKEEELDAVRESIKSCNLDLDLKGREVQSLENSIRELCQQLESKSAELGEIQKLIEEQTHELEVKLNRRDSIELLIKKNLEELAAKEKRQEEMSEALRSRSMEIESKDKKLVKIEETIKKLSEKQHSKEKHWDSTQRHLKQCTFELESKQKDLDVVKETLRNHSEDLEFKQRDFNSLQLRITDYHKQIETSEKEVQDLESFIEEISSKLRVKQDMLSSIERSIKNRIDELASKELELSSVKMKIKEIKEIESKEEQYTRLSVSLKEREEDLELKEAQFNARAKSCELKEQQLESEQKKFAKCVDDFEQKVKKMSSFCQQGKTDQSGDLLGNLKPKDDKSLQILLNEYLKKFPQLHVEVSDALKASSEPARLVLDIIQQFFSPQPTMKEADFNENVVRKSCICLLECLMAVSPDIKPGVQAEAIKLATEFKNKTQVMAENTVEVLSFLHFLAVFSLAYAFGTSELQSLFDVATLRRYAPSLCKVLGISALASVNYLLSSNGMSGQPPDVAISANATRSLSLAIQRSTAVSELVCQLPPREDGLMDTEVSAALRSSPDPAKFVLDLIPREICGTNQQGEMGCEDSLVNNCILLLEELSKVPRHISPHVRFEASKLAIQWKGKLQIGTPTPLEALGFLLLLVAYDLVDIFSRDEISKLACSVALYKHALNLFQSLGLTDDIPNLVLQLVGKEHYIAAARLICLFKLNSKLSPMPLLKKEIEDLRQSPRNINVEKTSIDSQAEDKDVWKMKIILELIADFKLDIDIPGDLVARFLIQQGNQSQRGFSSVPIQLPVSSPAVQMQPTSITICGSDASYPASPCALSHPQPLGVFDYQALHTESQNQVRLKRPRSETMLGRPLVGPYMNSSSRFHPPGNGWC